MSLQPQPRVCFDDWLTAERQAIKTRSEFVRGEVFAMAGASEAHNQIVTNLSGLLWSQFRGRSCYVYTSDMKVRIEAADAGVYPDLVAGCGEREYYDDRKDIIVNPALIIEVLSDSTEAYDRGDKFANYRAIPCLQTYVLVSQYKVGAELYIRQRNDEWVLKGFDVLSDTLPLASVEASLPLAEVYDKVVFE